MLYDKVYNSIIKNSPITKGCTVICALSGGADSVCLADIMLGLKDKLGIAVECAHLNHNLRGKEADADEAFVTSFCKERGIAINKLATMSDVKQSTLDNIVRGLTKNPRVKTLHKIALAFNMTLAEFLDFEELNEYSFEDDNEE